MIDKGHACWAGTTDKNVALMKGYLNRKKANDEFMDSQGFAHTGDLGYYDDDGVMHYVDRLKALMKYAPHRKYFRIEKSKGFLKC